MIEFLLLDLDDTILDFHKSEKIALTKTLREFGMEPTEETCALYSRINQEHWERLERKELTRPQVMTGRFATLMAHLGVEGDPAACSERYTDNLAMGHYFLPGARETLDVLAASYPLYIVSNGNLKVQEGRLASANISHLFRDIFISQQIGADKPDPAFFEKVFERIPGFQKEKAMIVGDSLTSDILGGINMGIRTCWVNPQGKETKDIRPDYEISGIHQLPQLLQTLSLRRDDL